MLTSLLAKASEKGAQESLWLAADIARSRVRRLSDGKRQAFVFLSPPLNNSGAPHILLQVVDEFVERYGSDSVRLLAPPAAAKSREHASVCGVTVERAAEVLSPALVRLQLALQKHDFVLMNTVAVSRNYLSLVLDSLREGRLAHAYWYIHEDIDQLRRVAPSLLEPDIKSLIGELVGQGRLSMLVPSQRVKTEYDSLFGTKKTRLLPFKIDLETLTTDIRQTDDYASLKFLISGSPTDGRKGHMVALAAFHEFMKTYYEPDPDTYRPFTLTLLGLTDDYISEQIRSIGSTVLGDRLKALSSVSHEQALEITRDCNAVICCSFNEALPLSVIEGMCAGHIVLRNDVGGMEEQLEGGVNGYQIDSTNIRQFAGVLESVLNKKTMPDRRLQAMGRASQDLVARLRIPSYVDAIAASGSDSLPAWHQSRRRG